MESLKGLRIAIYARFSSENQNDRSIDDQVRLCREYVDRNGGTISEDLVYADYAVSGSTRSRTGFDQVLRLIDSKTVDAIVTESGSRLSRDLGDADRLWKLAKFNAVRLICVNDGIDSVSQGARLQFAIKSLMADEYLADLSKATRRGQVGAAEAGHSTGGLPYGYTSEFVSGGRRDGHRIIIDQEKSKIVRRIFQLYEEGHSLLGIAEVLNQEKVPPPRAGAKSQRAISWRKTTLRELLRNRSYLGEWSFGERRWEKDPVTRKRRYRKQPESEVRRYQREDLRVIDDETWKAVHARMAAVEAKYRGESAGTVSTATGTKCPRPLSGLLVCECGRPLVYSGGSSAVYYRCAGANSGSGCPHKQGIREDALVEACTAELTRILTETSLYDTLREKLEARLTTFKLEVVDQSEGLTRRIGELDREIERLVEFVAKTDPGPALDVVAKKLDHAAKEKKDLASQLEELKSRATSEGPSLPDPEELLALALDVKNRLTDDPIRARELLRNLLGGRPIRIVPQGDGSFRAESVLFVETIKAKRPRVSGPSVSSENSMVARGRYARGLPSEEGVGIPFGFEVWNRKGYSVAAE